MQNTHFETTVKIHDIRFKMKSELSFIHYVSCMVVLKVTGQLI